jgi:deoxyribodipyrimidine photo-lyase
MTRSLVWFRNDLRVSDNPALHQALQQGDRISALYIDCTRQNREHGQSQIQADFIRRNLDCLEQTLQSLDIRLHRLRCDLYAQVPALLQQFCTRHAIEQVFANREVPINERLRDKAVKQETDIPLQLCNGDCVMLHGTIRKNDGSMYRVFTPFSQAWLAELARRGYALHAAPSGARLAPPDQHAWPAGEVAALERLRDFCGHRLHDYAQQRDFPAAEATSSLSPYLAIGVLSPRQCLAAIEQQLGYLPMSKGETGFAWLNELIWREFYRHLMVEFPDLSRNRPFKPETTELEWCDNEAHFKAWTEGRSGYPIVDAAMRCLSSTGWMHNRLRMIVASFLTKDLQIHWRKGEDYFMSQLIDGDLAANNGGWQWAASTGADAAPYFRIFNPATQGERFDPKGQFTRHWLPELQAVPDKFLYQPRAWLDRHDPGNAYPRPIVDHRRAREQTLARFAAIKSA